MNPYNIDENPFNVYLTERDYTVEPFCGVDDDMRYRILHRGKYLFTMLRIDNGKWTTSKDNCRVDDAIVKQLSVLIARHFKGSVQYTNPLYERALMFLS